MLCAVVLLRSASRSGSRMLRRVGAGFVALVVANLLRIVDAFLPGDFSIPRAALVAVGLGILVYGIAWEEAA